MLIVFSFVIKEVENTVPIISMFEDISSSSDENASGSKQISPLENYEQAGEEVNAPELD